MAKVTRNPGYFTLTLRISTEQNVALDEESARTYRAKSEIVREAIREYLLKLKTEAAIGTCADGKMIVLTRTDRTKGGSR